MKFTIITLFEDAIKPYLSTSMMWKAVEKEIVEFDFVNLRDFGLGPHKSVDDTPYGGGDGMLLRCEPVFSAIESVKEKDPSAKVILPTPVGITWNQELARKFACGKVGFLEDVVCEATSPLPEHEDLARAACPGEARRGACSAMELVVRRPIAPKQHYIILCPHYEGYDERILSIVDYKISLGNYILTGGELPALIIIDSIVRLLPGVLGGETSAEIESFSDGDNLEYPQYTKPADFRGMKVPDILLSGNHGEIKKWRDSHASKHVL